MVGYANVVDTAEINKIIHSELAKSILPPDVKLLWSAKPAEGTANKRTYELYCLRMTGVGTVHLSRATLSRAPRTTSTISLASPS